MGGLGVGLVRWGDEMGGVSDALFFGFRRARVLDLEICCWHVLADGSSCVGL
jgi:hypothetical protein